MNLLIKLNCFFLILLAFISPPSVFSEINFGRELRSFISLIVLILMIIQIKKIKLIHLCFIIILILIISLEIFLQRSLLNHVLSNYTVILVAITFYVFLCSNKNNLDIFLKIWSNFSQIVCLFAIISFFFHQFINFDAYSFYFIDNEFFNNKYDYKISVFGLTVFKNFGVVNIERVSSFFYEPQYAGLFFAFNSLLFKFNKNLISKNFFLLNTLAGLLTFSITFYIILPLILLSNLKKKQKLFLVVIFLYIFVLALSAYFFQDISFLKKNSLSDRINRNAFYFDIILNANFDKLLFGHGIKNFESFDFDKFGKGLSSGFLYLLFEFGILISIYFFSLFIMFSNRYITLIIVALTYFAIMPWFKYFFCWYIIIIAGLTFKINRASYKNIKLN